MYVPAAFAETETAKLHEFMRNNSFAVLTSSGEGGLVASHLPLLIDPDAGPNGHLLGHMARANSQWRRVDGDVMAVFSGPHAYVSPSWYEEAGTVPTWNYVAVHAYGPVEFFDDPGRLLEAVRRLTDLHEGARPSPWAVPDAPPDFVQAQLRGIVGLRMPITRLEGKRKMSQNRSAIDRAGVAAGLATSDRASERAAAELIPT